MNKVLTAILIGLIFMPLSVLANGSGSAGGMGFASTTPAFPSFPMSFYGTATLNGSPLPTGARISAFASSTFQGDVTLSEAGVYGYDDPIKNKLVVSNYTETLILKYTLQNTATLETGCALQQYSGGFAPGKSVLMNLSFKNTGCGTSVIGSTGGGPVSVSSGGGSSAPTPAACASVSYSPWQSSCTNDVQLRTITTQLPTSCTLTAEQQLATKRACQVAATTDEGATTTTKVLGIKIENGSSDNNSIDKSSDAEDKVTAKKVIAEERALVKKDDKVAKRLRGQILIQVEKGGQAWYVNPDSGKKYFLGRPADAFAVMRGQGLGVKNSVIKNTKIYPSKLLGKILINVEDKGRAYYINPKDKKAYYLGRPADAFAVMQGQGLGISNADIRKIEVGG